MRQAAVGEARDRVLFVNQQRPAQQPGRQAARAGDEAAEPDHQRRAPAADHGQRLQQRARQLQRRASARPAAPLPRRPPTDSHSMRNVLGRHQPRFQSAPRAEPHHLPGARAQLARQRQRRKHMAAGAARHDQRQRRAAWRR